MKPKIEQEKVVYLKKFTISLLNLNVLVLNFFPIPVEEECNSLDGHRKGKFEAIFQNFV